VWFGLGVKMVVVGGSGTNGGVVREYSVVLSLVSKGQ